MQAIPIIFDLFLVSVLAFFYYRSPNRKELREKIKSNKKAAFIISLIMIISVVLGSPAFPDLNVQGIETLNIFSVFFMIPTVMLPIFTFSLAGLVFASSISNFKPLALQNENLGLKKIFNFLVITLGLTAALVVLGLATGEITDKIANFFGEPMPQNKQIGLGHPVSLFFIFLSGAGIAEEVFYRLFAMTLIWKVTGKAWVGILGSTLLFTIYHFTPLDGMYQQFLTMPIRQAIPTLVLGTAFALIYKKWGLEKAILSHALLDWFFVFLPYYIKWL